MKEKEDYREQLMLAFQKIDEAFPGNLGMLTCAEAAAYLGCNVKTVREAIKRRSHPLPAKTINPGSGKPIYRIPVASLIRWSLS